MTHRLTDGVYVVTGGLGFIGAELVKQLLWLSPGISVVTLDAMTYAAAGGTRHGDGSYAFFQSPQQYFMSGARPPSSRHTVIKCNLGRINPGDLLDLLKRIKPHGVFHLAASTHVDRSIDSYSRAEFVESNVNGTQSMLQASHHYWRDLPASEQSRRCFLHCSTDEVYGDASKLGREPDERSPLAPSNVYAATKAAAELLVGAYATSFGLPTVITRGANTYGPFQYPEKLIPRSIGLLTAGRPAELYGGGHQSRLWMRLVDHATSLIKAFDVGDLGETYNVGLGYETTNYEVIQWLAAMIPTAPSPFSLTVEDRPGHDVAYAMSSDKFYAQVLGGNYHTDWTSQESFRSGLAQTASWYASDSGRRWTSAIQHDVTQRQGVHV